MRRAVPLVLTVVAVLGVSVVLLVSGILGGGPDPADPDPVVPVPDLPEGITADVDEGLLCSSDEITWNVIDLLGTYMLKQGYRWVENPGVTTTGTSIHLDPGVYRVTVGDTGFEITIPGTITRTSSWSYDYDGTVHRVGVTYIVDAAEVSLQKSRSVEFNQPNRDYLFEDLPSLVEVTKSVRSLEDALGNEFERIGGDIGDRQSYADFIASFPQLAIEYPYRASGHGEDYSIYGLDEYWARPLETMVLQYGDCDDTAVLASALYIAAGYQAAVGGYSGHVFSGVALDSFEEVSKERRKEVNKYNSFSYAAQVPVAGTAVGALVDTLFYAVETTKGQIFVGYLTSGMTYLEGEIKTKWGLAGFYPVQGAESGIQGSS